MVSRLIVIIFSNQNVIQNVVSYTVILKCTAFSEIAATIADHVDGISVYVFPFRVGKVWGSENIPDNLSHWIELSNS